MVSQPERSTSMTASTSPSVRRRSKTGTSGDVPVAGMEGVLEAALAQRGGELVDARRYGHRDLVAEDVVDLAERDLVVARVLLAAHEAHAAGGHALLDELHEVELAVVLARVAHVEDLARDLVLRRLQDERDAAGRVAHVHVGPPELLPEDLEVAVGPQVAGELVDREVEAHAGGDAIDGGEAQAGDGREGRRLEQVALHGDLLLGVQG